MEESNEKDSPNDAALPCPPNANSNDLGPSAIGRVDWSPLSPITGTRPLVSKYGVARYSPMEWRNHNDSMLGKLPGLDGLEHESNTIIRNISADVDKKQLETTQRLRQRAADIYSYHEKVRQYTKEIKTELDQLAQCRLRLRNAIEAVRVVEGINEECREIRKNRLTEDLVRDDVEEELFQEKGLCQEVRLLYNSAMTEFDMNMSSLKSVNVEIQAMWSDQSETLQLETDNIGMDDRSTLISYCHGTARLEANMSSVEHWEKFTKETLENVKKTLESSRYFRKKLNSPVIEESVNDLVRQADKIVKAFLRRIEETQNALADAESELGNILKRIAHCEQLYVDLETLGRQIDYNLKVVQTRLDNRRKRPGVEQCRDSAQHGLMTEIKVICQRVTVIQTQLDKLFSTIKDLYAMRKKLERQIHVKKHTLNIDRERCMLFRKQFPNPAILLGH